MKQNSKKEPEESLEQQSTEEVNSKSFERMLQKSGRGSIALVLPHTWVNQSGLKVHDKIFVRWQQDGSLRLAPLKQSEREHWIFVIDAKQYELPHSLGRAIISAYVEGFNKIKVTGNGGLQKEQYNDVLSTVGRLIGLAMIGDSGSSIVIKSYLDPLKNDVPQLFVRIYSLSSAMLRDSLAALIGSDFDTARRVANVDTEVNKIYYLILRQLFTAARDPVIAEALRIVRPLNIVSDRTVAHLIEDIGDECVSACTKLLESTDTPHLKPEFEAKALELRVAICSLYDRAYRAFCTSDRKVANAVIEDSKKLENDALKFETCGVSCGVSEAMLHCAVAEQIVAIARHCRSFGEMTFNRAIGMDTEDLMCEGVELNE